MKKVLGEMTRKVMFAYETDYLDDVWNTMSSIAVRHIPILRDRRVVGILSDRDIMKSAKLAKNGGMIVPHQLVNETMTRNVFTCKSTDSIGEVARTFIEEKIDALPVVNDSGDLMGIITSTDLLNLLSRHDGELFKELPFNWEPLSLLKSCWRPEAAI